MTIYLRKDTASQEILIGPMISSTDGITAQTGLTIANTDIVIWKAGATTVGAKNSGGALHISGGRYYATLDDTDTNTLGSMIIEVNVATALMWRGEFAVLSQETYDAWFGTAHLATASALATVDGIVDDILVDTAVIGALGAGLTGIPWNSAWDAEVQSECADALAAYDPPTNAEMEARTIIAANYATAAALTTIDDFLDTEVASILAAVDTEVAAILADTNELQTDWANGGRLDLLIDGILEDTGTTIPATITVIDDFLDTEIAAILADTNELQTDWHDGGRLDLLLDGAASAGDPWSTALPGAYGAGTAGLLLGTTIPTAIADIPTVAEMEARTLVAANYFDPAADVVAHVTLVDTTTTNTDMRGTNSAALASVCTEGRLAELDAANLPTDIDNVYDDVGDVKAVVDAILVDTGTTLDTLIKDIPTVAEFEARTLPAADYTIVSDLPAAGPSLVQIEASTVLAKEATLTTIDGIIDDIKTEVLTHPTLAEIEATTVLAKDSTVAKEATLAVIDGIADDIKAEVLTHPTLAEIEASTVIAKEATLTTIDGIVDDILVDTGTTLDALIKRTLGLVEENIAMISATYSLTGKQTGAVWKTYPTAGDVVANTNAIATYTMTATYDVDDNLETYKVVKS